MESPRKIAGPWNKPKLVSEQRFTPSVIVMFDEMSTRGCSLRRMLQHWMKGKRGAAEYGEILPQ